ncbi:hypothetical protein TNCV_4994871 [Trichonephila clavipes]|nr:hypothetical protein TNCV_4994871 [Trichonephila clavipes]
MALSDSLPQINLGVQGDTQSGLHNIPNLHNRVLFLSWLERNAILAPKISQEVGPLDEFRFNFSSDDNGRVLWRPRGERLNLAFAFQRHTAGVMFHYATSTMLMRKVFLINSQSSPGIRDPEIPGLKNFMRADDKFSKVELTGTLYG